VTEKKVVDWEAVEREYRAGIRSLKDIGDEYGVSAPGILKRAKKEEWTRDLTAKIKAKADAKVNAALVNDSVNEQSKVTERELVDVVAGAQASVQIGQRKDVTRARGIVQKLFAEIEGQIDGLEELSELGELMRREDDRGQDKLNDLYQKIIAFPSRVDSAKKLTESLRIAVELERKVWRIKDDPEPASTVAAKADPTLSPSDAYMRMIGK
jgi:hypothetical protein